MCTLHHTYFWLPVLSLATTQIIVCAARSLEFTLTVYKNTHQLHRKSIQHIQMMSLWNTHTLLIRVWVTHKGMSWDGAQSVSNYNSKQIQPSYCTTAPKTPPPFPPPSPSHVLHTRCQVSCAATTSPPPSPRPKKHPPIYKVSSARSHRVDMHQCFRIVCTCGGQIPLLVK